MIRVTRFNGSSLYVNADLVRFVEGTPDTVITMTDNIKIIVKESPDLIVERIIEYQGQVGRVAHKSSQVE